MIRLYDYLPSGNGYKIRLLLTQLEIFYEVVELDITEGRTRDPAFLAKNPNGKIPTVELDDGRFLFESHAIASYFAEGTRFIPEDAYERALMWQWMCFEQYNLEPCVGTLRYWRNSLGQTPDEIGEARYREKIDGGYRALGILDAQLAGRSWVATDTYGLADVSLYAYSHVAGEGDFDLQRYPNVVAGHERVRSQPRHIPITQATA